MTLEEISKLKIPANYVLVLPDPDYEEYQRFGKSTGILVGNTLDTSGVNVSVKGTVYQIPTRLDYYGNMIGSLKSRPDDQREVLQEQIDDLTEKSVKYKVPMEVSVGDRVAFFYRNQFDCRRDGRVVETELGEMLLMKYDTLFYKVDDQNNCTAMLNGLLIIEPIEKPQKTKTGIYITTKLHTDVRTKAPWGYGRIIQSGCLVSGYLEFPNDNDNPYDKILPGTAVMYNPRYQVQMEHDTHQQVFDRRLFRIHRKDVFGTVVDESKIWSEI